MFSTRSMSRRVLQLRRSSAQATRKASDDQSNSQGLFLLLGGVLAGGVAVTTLSKPSSMHDLYNKEKKRTQELEKQLADLAGSADAAKEESKEGLAQLSDEFMQCTKGSEQLTGDLEHMASRMKATQEELRSSRQRMDELTRENDDYLKNIADKGELISVRRVADGEVSLAVGANEPVTGRDLQFDKSSGELRFGSTTVVIPQERREIIVGQLASLADKNNVKHNLVGNFV